MREYLGGGCIKTIITTPEGRLLKTKKYIGVDTEITQTKWRKKQ